MLKESFREEQEPHFTFLEKKKNFFVVFEVSIQFIETTKNTALNIYIRQLELIYLAIFRNFSLLLKATNTNSFLKDLCSSVTNGGLNDRKRENMVKSKFSCGLIYFGFLLQLFFLLLLICVYVF